MKKMMKNIPVIGPIFEKTFRHWSKPMSSFSGSENYWIDRYASGGNSGFGSYNELSQFKAEVLNNFIFEKNIDTVIEYGCGDGNQLILATYRKYIGFDISEKAIFMCRKIFKNDRSRKFELLKKYNGEVAQLTISLDVIYHLVEDHVFSNYMERLFDSAKNYVIIYSSDTNLQEHEQSMHVKHRKFTDWVQINKLEWKLQQHIPNRYPPVKNEKIGSSSDFFVYIKNNI